jgi:hypothetical protein
MIGFIDSDVKNSWKSVGSILFLLFVISYGLIGIMFLDANPFLSGVLVILGISLFLMYTAIILENKKLIEYLPGIMLISGIIVIGLVVLSKAPVVVQLPIGGLGVFIAYAGGIIRGKITSSNEEQEEKNDSDS